MIEIAVILLWILGLWIAVGLGIMGIGKAIISLLEWLAFGGHKR